MEATGSGHAVEHHPPGESTSMAPECEDGNGNLAIAPIHDLLMFQHGGMAREPASGESERLQSATGHWGSYACRGERRHPDGAGLRRIPGWDIVSPPTRAQPRRTMNRRNFVSMLGAGALVWPTALDTLMAQVSSGGAPQDEDFWRLVREQFLIPEGRIYLNNGTLGPSPRVVVDAVVEHTRRVAQTFPPGVAWDDLKTALGVLLDGDAEGFVFPRNTTEAMNFVANGLEIGAGDEVVTTDHEHIGGLKPWELIASRRGAKLKVVSLPAPLPNADEVVGLITDALTPQSRVLALSHLTFTTGAVLPVRELARECAERGIIFVIDGAHPPGMLDFSLRDTGGDFYASSPHKWLLAPQGTGLLYLAERWRTELWPTLASGGWDDLELGAHRLNHMGTMDESRLAGLLAAVGFFEVLGMERVEARVRHLNALLRTGLEGIPSLRIVSPPVGPQSSGMISFALDGVEALVLQRYLAREANVRTRVIGEYDYGWMRLSTHVYNSPAEITTVLELLDGVARGKDISEIGDP